MPPKKTTPAGELTAPELRKLIKAHNILSKITIPKGTDRQGLIKLIEGKKYKIDHKNKVIKPQQQRGKQITLKNAEELTKPKPVSEAVKKQRAEKKKEKEEEKKKDIKIAKKEAVQEFKKKQKEAKKEIKKAEKLNKKKDLKLKSISNNKKDMGETAFIKQQKKLQLEKQKETRRALLKSKPPVDKTTRRGKPVKSEEEKIKDMVSELRKEPVDKKELKDAITDALFLRENNPEARKRILSLQKGKTDYLTYIKSDKDKDTEKRIVLSLAILDDIVENDKDSDMTFGGMLSPIYSMKKTRVELELLDIAQKYLGIKISYDKLIERDPLKLTNIYAKIDINQVKNKIKELFSELKSYAEDKKKSNKKQILKSEKKPAVKKPEVKKGKGVDPINKLTGPEAEELWEKVEKLMTYDDGYARDSTGKSHVGSPSAYNLKERKELFKFFTSDKLPAREITKEEYKKIEGPNYQYSGLPSLYTQKITGVEKKEPKSYDKATWKFTLDKDKYMLLPQFFTDNIYGKEIKKIDTKKVRQIIEDYLKGDIGTKKKEVKKKLEVKDFTIIMKGKNYNKEEFLKWVDTKGYKFSKQQLEKLNFLVSERGLQSFRHYYNSNGVLVLVPTLKFNASTKVYNQETKKYEEISIGEVLSELAGQRGGSVLKLELKPKEKIELTPEKIKEYDMTRLQFIKEELPSLKKNQKETKDKLEVYLKEYKKLEDKNSPSGYSGSNGGLPFMRILQESKAKDWLFRIDTKYLGQGKKEENKLYIPQPVRDWYDKNVKDIQKLNLIVGNVYDTIKSYESKQKQLENKYN